MRKAAENAWAARLRATNALILSKMGKMPEYVPETTASIWEYVHRKLWSAEFVKQGSI